MLTHLNKFWTPERERCGVILKNGEVMELPNRSATPETDFVLAVEDTDGLDAAASWHTHCHSSANLSTEDYMAFLSRPEWSHYIVTQTEVWGYYVRNGKVMVYEDEDATV